MTQDSDFKRLVRERMARTGENYTTARATLMDAAPVRPEAPASGPVTHFETNTEPLTSAAREQQRLVARWFFDGRLRDVPAKRKVRVAVLLEVLRRFQPGRTYTEREVSDVLREVHPDFAYLRRELVDYGYLWRADGQYRVAARMPERGPVLRDELPAWEAEWLPGFLAGQHS